MFHVQGAVVACPDASAAVIQRFMFRVVKSLGFKVNSVKALQVMDKCRMMDDKNDAEELLERNKHVFNRMLLLLYRLGAGTDDPVSQEEFSLNSYMLVFMGGPALEGEDASVEEQLDKHGLRRERQV